MMNINSSFNITKFVLSGNGDSKNRVQNQQNLADILAERLNSQLNGSLILPVSHSGQITPKQMEAFKNQDPNALKAAIILLPIRLYESFDAKQSMQNLNRQFDAFVAKMNENLSEQINADSPTEKLQAAFNKFMEQTPHKSIIAGRLNIAGQLYEDESLQEFMQKHPNEGWYNNGLLTEFLDLMFATGNANDFRAKWLDLLQRNSAAKEQMMQKAMNEIETNGLDKLAKSGDGDSENEPFKPIEGKSHNSASTDDIAKQFFEYFIKAQSENGWIF